MQPALPGARSTVLQRKFTDYERFSDLPTQSAYQRRRSCFLELSWDFRGAFIQFFHQFISLCPEPQTRSGNPAPIDYLLQARVSATSSAKHIFSRFYNITFCLIDISCFSATLFSLVSQTVFTHFLASLSIILLYRRCPCLIYTLDSMTLQKCMRLQVLYGQLLYHVCR